MNEKLTVIIPCKNKAENIQECINSALKIADEVLVADSGSTDQTLDIVRSLGPYRIIEREYVNSGDFKNWAIPQASHPWVMILDGDERIPDDMAQEIRERISGNPKHDGYWVYRTNYFMGHRIRFSGWRNDKVMRLFRRDQGVYTGGTDHAEVTIRSGRIGALKHRMLHFTYWNYDQYFNKFQRYTTYQAEKWEREGRRFSMAKMFFNMPMRFLHNYIFRLGFLDGVAGLQVCLLTGFYSFMKQARLWQIQEGKATSTVDREMANRSQPAKTSVRRSAA